MAVIFRIAVRNLKHHKSKTLIIGIIITLGITILIVGNSMMQTASKGLERSFINNFSGHIMINGQTDGSLSLAGPGGGGPGHLSENEKISIIPEFSQVKEYAASIPEVEAITPQITGRAMLSSENGGKSELTFFGIEPESYRRMFTGNIELLAGAFLKPGDAGIVLSEKTAKDIKKNMEVSVKPGDMIVLSSFPGASALKVREVQVKGIFRFKSSNRKIDEINFMDMENGRVLMGLTVSLASEFELDDKETGLLDFDTKDSLFSGDMMEGMDNQSEVVDEQSLYNMLGDTGERTRLLQTDSQAWHFILIKLKDGARVNSVIENINNFFEEEGLEAKAYDWQTAAGMMGSLAYTVKTIFNLVILLIAIVAIIIIMNTLVISVTERTSELGTMRAIGAQKWFVRKMIIAETLITSCIFGAVGIVLGALILRILNITGIPASNMFLEVLFGGAVLHPVLSVSSVIYSLGIVAGIGVLASLYPVAVALRIEPVKAISKM